VHAMVFDPGGIASSGLRLRLLFDEVMVPSAHSDGVGSRGFTTFEALSHGLRTCCLRFAARVAPAPRKTRFRVVAGWWPTLPGRDFNPLGFRCEVSSLFSLTSPPPHPGLP
jgi:hypothetical protein